MPETVTSTISNSVSADYSTLQAWEDAAPVDLVAADQIWEGQIIAADTFSTGSSTALTISGSTVDSTRFKRLTVADGFSFADDQDNPLRFDATKGANIQTTSGQCFSIIESYAEIHRLQCKSTTATNQTSVIVGVVGGKIADCLLESDNANGSYAGNGLVVVNTLFINRTGGQSRLLEISGSNPKNIINCTFVVPSDKTANTHCFSLVSAGNVQATNSCFMNCSSTAIASGTGTEGYTTCAADKASPPSGVTNISFANAGFRVGVNTNSDFRTYENSLFKNAGTTSSTHASTDIFGNARPVGAAYDIGAYEKPLPATITSTISKSVTADYSTPQAWEDAAPADLITADQVWKGVIVAPDNFSDTSGFVVTFFGSTTSATTYKELTVAPGASFADNTDNPLRYDATKGASISVTSGQCIRIDEAYARVSRLQCYATTAATPILVLVAGKGAIIDQVIMGSENFNGQFRSTVESCKITNSLFINRVGSKGSIVSVVGSGALVDIYNCTFVVPSDITANTGAIYTDPGTTVNATNCAFFNTSSTALVSGTGTVNFTTCAADRASPPAGVTNISFANAGFVVGVNASSNFKISSSSSLKDIGTESPTYASTDIFGEARPYNNNYDIGCHEYAVYAADGLAYSHSFNKRRRRHL